jgi:uncharacterized membrane protein
MTADIVNYFARFHPLLVHLPIGFLCFAILMEILRVWKQEAAILKIVSLLWLATAISSTLSAGSGYFLSQGGGYDNEILVLHKYGGIGLAILSWAIYLIHALPVFEAVRIRGVLRFGLVSLTFLLLLFTGHWGGSMTHGTDYLTTSIVAEDAGNNTETSRIKTLDSADIFRDAAMPIFQAKCVSCHNPEKKKGELLLTSYEEILAGGKTREGVIPGNTAASEIYKRITLPKDHKEFMPTDGKKPLTETQTRIIEWWIETGAHRKMSIAKMNPDKQIADVFNDFFQLDRDAILAYKAEPASENDLAALIKAGYQVNAISKSGNLLEVKFNGNGQNKPDLSLLANIKDQLVWLHLTNCGLTNEDLKVIAKLPHLYKLNLNRNKVSDQGASNLASLTKLEYLNLYGTEVTDSSLQMLTSLPELKKLYVWETKVDSAGVASLATKNKSLEVVYRLLP